VNNKPALTFRKVSPNDWRSTAGGYEIHRSFHGEIFFVGHGAQGLPDAKTLEQAQQIAQDHWAETP
jgi:hypothetical protein